MPDPGTLATIASVLAALDDLNARQSTVIQLINETDETLHLIVEEDNHESGEFATAPPATIPPFQKGAFGSKDKSPAFLTGDVGHLHYTIGDRAEPATWRLDWANPALATPGEDKNHAETIVFGTERNLFEPAEEMDPNGDAKVSATFTLTKVGVEPPPPPPPPGQERDIESTCIVSVVNDTNATLTLVDQGHERGDFFTFPGPQIDPGEFDSFGSVETEGAQPGGSKGFIQYRVGDGDTFVTLEWDNPENAQNTTAARVDGTNPGAVTVLDQIGAGEENVPVTFTISGSAGGVVPPPPPPPPVQEFVPPVQQDEPTLRLHDGVTNGMDGWVEYLQSMLIQWGHDINIDGVFGQATLRAVRNFQDTATDSAGGPLQVDGIVGHQTWAALQQEAPRDPSTDGRAPHSHVEQGPEARWWTEGSPFYFDDEDRFIAFATNTGNVAIAPGDFTATAIITGIAEQVELTIEDGAEPGSGLFFQATGLKERLGPGSHPVTAFMPDQLGGDNVSDTIDID